MTDPNDYRDPTSAALDPWRVLREREAEEAAEQAARAKLHRHRLAHIRRQIDGIAGHGPVFIYGHLEISFR